MNSEVLVKNNRLHLNRLLSYKTNPYISFCTQVQFNNNDGYLILNKDIIPINNMFYRENIRYYPFYGSYRDIFFGETYGEFLTEILSDVDSLVKDSIKEITLRDIIKFTEHNEIIYNHISSLCTKNKYQGETINYRNLNHYFIKNDIYNRRNESYSKWAVVINGEILFLRYIHKDNINTFMNISNMIFILKNLDEEYFKDKITELTKFLDSIVITKVCNKLIDKRNKKRKLKEIINNYLSSITSEITYQEEIINDEVIFKLKKPKGNTPRELKVNILEEVLEIMEVKKDE